MSHLLLQFRYFLLKLPLLQLRLLILIQISVIQFSSLDLLNFLAFHFQLVNFLNFRLFFCKSFGEHFSVDELLDVVELDLPRPFIINFLLLTVCSADSLILARLIIKINQALHNSHQSLPQSFHARAHWIACQ